MPKAYASPGELYSGRLVPFRREEAEASDKLNADKPQRYKEYYTSVFDRKKNVIAFERQNDVPSRGEVERIVAGRE